MQWHMRLQRWAHTNKETFNVYWFIEMFMAMSIQLKYEIHCGNRLHWRNAKCYARNRNRCSADWFTLNRDTLWENNFWRCCATSKRINWNVKSTSVRSPVQALCSFNYMFITWCATKIMRKKHRTWTDPFEYLSFYTL